MGTEWLISSAVALAIALSYAIIILARAWRAYILAQGYVMIHDKGGGLVEMLKQFDEVTRNADRVKELLGGHQPVRPVGMGGGDGGAGGATPSSHRSPGFSPLAQWCRDAESLLRRTNALFVDKGSCDATLEGDIKKFLKGQQ